MERIQTVGVVGAGTMGLGIAQVCASSGFDVLLYDLNPDQVENALRTVEANLSNGVAKGKITLESKVSAISRIRKVTSLSQVTADLVIEAATENLALKQRIFRNIVAVVGPTCVLATNTSRFDVEISLCFVFLLICRLKVLI